MSPTTRPLAGRQGAGRPDRTATRRRWPRSARPSRWPARPTPARGSGRGPEAAAGRRASATHRGQGQLTALKAQLDAQLAQQQTAEVEAGAEQGRPRRRDHVQRSGHRPAGHQDRQAGQAEGGAEQDPVAVQRHASLADGRRDHASSSAAPGVSEPRVGSCAHFHQGIDIAAPCYTPVHAAGAGVVVFVGYNPYDAPPRGLAGDHRPLDEPGHLVRPHDGQGAGGIHVGAPSRPARSSARRTRPATPSGCHLHWAVRVNGVFMNPRLFL